ncbi:MULTISPECIES: hypothetical protein [Aquimarina]|uniref:Uncharacterized protein n=1 Tax=Aquimarina algiphila TaxID=2047982 RepID=A0A554VQV8_9FLAO|nr:MULTISPECIES: hypothetical protein [Aquimarina]TSE11011.1 hypothetical protein FOF46_01945 [Aquimarina algiphila]
MKKSILDFGKTLSKSQQQKIVGGARICDHSIGRCYEGSAPTNDLNRLVYLDSEGVYHIF